MAIHWMAFLGKRRPVHGNPVHVFLDGDVSLWIDCRTGWRCAFGKAAGQPILTPSTAGSRSRGKGTRPRLAGWPGSISSDVRQARPLVTLGDGHGEASFDAAQLREQPHDVAGERASGPSVGTLVAAGVELALLEVGVREGLA